MATGAACHRRQPAYSRMFPLTNTDNLQEFWLGTSELEGSSSAFDGLSLVFYR